MKNEEIPQSVILFGLLVLMAGWAQFIFWVAENFGIIGVLVLFAASLSACFNIILFCSRSLGR